MSFRLMLWTLGACFVLSSTAQAGPPSHLSLPDPIAGFTLNHACGVAVDSQGDIYVANAGNSRIEVFDPAGNHLGSISNSEEPCALAVNSKGELFVTERSAGSVVRYKPGAYPFGGSPSYGAAEPIDLSGKAHGIAIDSFDDRLYVAEEDRVAAYNADGSLGIDEVDAIAGECTAGSFKLIFEGQETTSLPCNTNAAEVEVALAGLSTIGAGNVSVVEGEPGYSFDVIATFAGALANTNIAPLTTNTTGLSGTVKVFSSERESDPGESHVDGFSGYLGEGDLMEATGVAAYTYRSANLTAHRHVFVADGEGTNPDRVDVFGGSDIRQLRLQREILGPVKGEAFGFESEDAYLAADPGNRNAEEKCTQVGDQACTEGHFFLYDATHNAVDEFDASGEFLDQLPSSGLSDAKPTAIAIDRSGGTNDGTVYVTSGPDAASKLLAFGPLTAPSRPPADALSHVLVTARAVTTDSRGDVYVVTGGVIHVFSPQGVEIAVGPSGNGIDDPNNAEDIAVDSTGKLYVLDGGKGLAAEAKLTYYTPNAYPPLGGTTYSRHEPPIDTLADFGPEPGNLEAIAVNPANDHVFLTAPSETHELDSAAAGHESKLLDSCFACGINLGFRDSIAVDAATGDVYIANGGGSPLISVTDPQGDEVLSRITGAGSPRGPFKFAPHIAADQSNGHVVELQPGEAAREYDAAGGFVAEFGSFSPLTTNDYRVAVDNACALHEPPLAASSTACRQFDPANGTVYIAYDDPENANHPYDLTAFGPLAYGEPPVAKVSPASGFGSGGATLNGTVDPNGLEVTGCRFEYLTDEDFKANEGGFEGATSLPCAEGSGEIGTGSSPVPVHVSIPALPEPEGRYRFRLIAENKYGSSGEDSIGLFGPPVAGIERAFPVGYDEVTLRASLDPAGLPTTYHFDYLPQSRFEEQGGFDGPATLHTQSVTVPAGAPPAEITAVLTGLAEGIAYRFRFVAENADRTVIGSGAEFETLRRRVESCPNAEYRTGLSANLPDCRAYELVTPAQTNGLSPHAANLPTIGSAEAGFNDSLVTPRGSGAGETLSYFTLGTLPGFDGNGSLDAYRAQRGEGAHPASGWVNTLFSPTYCQASPDFSHTVAQQGVASDQLYSAWVINPSEACAEGLASGSYLRTPTGFEPLGRGSQGVDLAAISNYESLGGAHVVFSSSVELEEAAPPAGVRAIYERAAGRGTSQMISIPPAGASPTVEAEFHSDDAIYVGTSEDGATIVFKVNGVLYAHREGQTVEAAASPNTFAGIFNDGGQVFFANAVSSHPPESASAGLFSCDITAGPCAGPGAHAPASIGPDGTTGIFVNVSPDGSHVFFESEEELGEGEANENGEVAEEGALNLYTWDMRSDAVSFVAQLVPEDLEEEGFLGTVNMSLGLWTSSIVPGQYLGRAQSPTRATPDGSAFVFQSHAQLTDYDNEGVGEIYRYDPGAPIEGRLLCISCDPNGAAPTGIALLEDTRAGSGIDRTTMIPNVTDDGQRVLFESPDRLVPEDANDIVDVYEWEAEGSGGCQLGRGCISLISSGQGETDNHLYGMSADGHDVFIRTQEKLVEADLVGSPSIYDAREGGGIPEPVSEAPCQGDACQGTGSQPPELPTPITSGGGSEGSPTRHCGKGRHRVKGRCVKLHKRHHHKRHTHAHRKRKG